ncbi:TPA: hypothetical protein VBA85_002067 [Streptococcus agalactiae]|nr:hypothetical protein [Streptococcus agalactiae]
MKNSMFHDGVTLQSVSPTAQMILLVLSSLLVYQIFSDVFSDILAFTVRSVLLIGAF